jgi:hypothetical protein
MVGEKDAFLADHNEPTAHPPNPKAEPLAARARPLTKAVDGARRKIERFIGGSDNGK